MSNIYYWNDKPYEEMTKEERIKHYEEATGKKYKEPTEEERRAFLEEYSQYMTQEQKKKYGIK